MKIPDYDYIAVDIFLKILQDFLIYFGDPILGEQCLQVFIFSWTEPLRIM